MSRRVASLTVTAALGVGLLAAVPALPASAKSISSSNLKALTTTLNKGKHLTYDAQYTSVNGGQKETITVAQAPPKSLFSSEGSGSVIDTGKTRYYCGVAGNTGNSGNTGNTGNTGNSGNSGNSGASTTTTTAKATVSCVTEKGSNSALGGVEDLFSPAVLIGLLNEDQNRVLGRALGVKVISTTSATFAGQPSTCLSVTAHNETGKYCVTKQGLLAYSGSSKTNYFELTKYSSKPPSNLFTLPAGATTQTLPGGGSTP